jgi:ABC-type sugar transport system permease subunit
MTATVTERATAPGGVPERRRRPTRALSAEGATRALAAWHVIHLLLAGAAAVAITTSTTLGAGLTIALLVGAAAAAIGDVIAVVGLLRRRHSGRMAALVVDYLTFVGALVVLLQVTDTFRGLDALAETFTRGVPFLVLAIVAYAATARAGLQTIGKWVGIAALGAMLLAVGLLPGLLTFVSRLGSPTALVLVAVLLVSGVASARAKQPDMARHHGASTRNVNTIDGLLFVSPNLLGFFAFFAGPLLFSLWVSMNDWDAFGTPEFIGAANYVRILSLTIATAGPDQVGSDVLLSGYTEMLRIGRIVVGAQDPLFWTSIRNIIVFAGLAIPLSVIPALFIATLLNSNAPGIKAFRALYFVPSIAGVVAVALIWRQLFNSTVGWVNYLLGQLAGLWNAIPLLPDVDPGQPQWLSSTSLSLISLVIVFAWQYVGFNTVLFLAGLQSIDPTLNEAAMLDGASRWQRFRYITVPQLGPTTFFVVASTGILALQLFGEAVVLFPTNTPIGSGPQNSTLTPVVYLYDQGFRRFAQGYASAVAWVLFILIFAFTFVQFRRQRAEVEGV